MTGASKAERSKLGGRVGQQLARDLALTDASQSVLAEKYGVSQQSVSEFKARRKEQIAAIAASADDEYAGLWIADKMKRLAELERLHEIALTPTPKVSAKGTTVSYYDPETGETETVMEVNLGEARQAMKQASEELGQLANRITLAGGLENRTHYTIEGVDPESLR